MLGPSKTGLSRVCSLLTQQTVLSPAVVKLCPSSAVNSIQLLVNRQYSYHRISRNLEYFSADDDAVIKRASNSLCVTSSAKPSSTGRPLTILMSWLMSKDKHVKKFAKFYTDLGMDVLKIRISPFDLIRPTKGSQVVASQMLDFLHQNPSYGTILVHGFSVGGYVFCEGLVQVKNDMAKHEHLLDRFVGQIWDSPVDIEGIPNGASRAISNNRIIQASIKKYLTWHMKMNYKSATIHYNNSSAMMHEGFLKSPSLFLHSKADVVADPAMVAAVYDKWEKKGHTVFVKCFEKSRHVSHYHMHQKEYVEQVVAFLMKLGLVEGDRTKVAM